MKWPRQGKRWLEEATKGKAQWVWRVEKKDHALTLPFPWLKAYYKIVWNLWITFEVRSLFKVNEAQQQISHKLWSDNCFRDACVRHDCWSRSQRNAHPLLKGTQTNTADIIGVCISFKKQHLLLDKHSLNIQECQLSYIYSTGMGLSQRCKYQATTIGLIVDKSLQFYSKLLPFTHIGGWIFWIPKCSWKSYLLLSSFIMLQLPIFMVPHLFK